jgi:hypothetical protein
MATTTTMMCLPRAAAAAASPRVPRASSLGSRSSSVVITRLPQKTTSSISSSRSKRFQAMAPFRNPFKAKPKEDKGPSGMEVGASCTS